jgi:glycosyltransferase involved in cell wall biosynthesis
MARLDFLCFGGEDWWYHNRGHTDMQLMRRFASEGTVLYINSIVMQKLNLGSSRKFMQRLVRKTKSIFNGLKKADAGFWVYSPFSLPVQHISLMKPLNEILLKAQIKHINNKIGIKSPVVWVACPPACDLAIGMKKKKLVYQRTDRFEDFPDVDVELVKSFDRKLKTSADLTIYVNSTLFHEEASQCRKAVYLDHGVDFDKFAGPAKSNSEPSDLSVIPHPRIGFIGSIDDCNPDIDFLEKVTDILPDMSFVIIGKEQKDCSALKVRKNVWMLGQKQYELVPEYGKRLDVLLLPLKQSKWAQAVNPLKLKEYLAMGKPVVSTPFPELDKYLDVVYKAESLDAFSKLIKTALSEDNSVLKNKRKEKVCNSSWDSKASVVLKELFEEDC